MPRKAPQDDTAFVHARRIVDGVIGSLCGAGLDPPEGRIPAADTAVRVTGNTDRVTCELCQTKLRRRNGKS